MNSGSKTRTSPGLSASPQPEGGWKLSLKTKAWGTEPTHHPGCIVSRWGWAKVQLCPGWQPTEPGSPMIKELSLPIFQREGEALMVALRRCPQWRPGRTVSSAPLNRAREARVQPTKGCDAFLGNQKLPEDQGPGSLGQLQKLYRVLASADRLSMGPTCRSRLWFEFPFGG